MLDTDAGWNPLYLSTIAGEFLVAPAATAAARRGAVLPHLRRRRETTPKAIVRGCRSR